LRAVCPTTTSPRLSHSDHARDACNHRIRRPGGDPSRHPSSTCTCNAGMNETYGRYCNYGEHTSTVICTTEALHVSRQPRAVLFAPSLFHLAASTPPITSVRYKAWPTNRSCPSSRTPRYSRGYSSHAAFQRRCMAARKMHTIHHICAVWGDQIPSSHCCSRQSQNTTIC
jgi:hypothetical protein